MQRNWIDRSEGVNIVFSVKEDGPENTGKKVKATQDESATHELTCFTTRPDTIFGATFLVASPLHPVVEELIAESDSVVARWRWQSINTRYGAPRTISIHGIAIFSFSDGKIARLWQVFDMKSFNDQAGIE